MILPNILLIINSKHNLYLVWRVINFGYLIKFVLFTTNLNFVINIKKFSFIVKFLETKYVR